MSWKGKMKTRNCLNCDKDISKYHPRQLYCNNVKCQKKRHCENVKRYYWKNRDKLYNMARLRYLAKKENQDEDYG